MTPYAREIMMDSTRVAVAAVREAWVAAVRAADADRLTSMVTDDVVVVHGDGRCIRGKEELKSDFLKAFELFRIDQVVRNPEVIRRGDWVFEIAEVESTLTPVRGGETRHLITTGIVALCRQPDETWKVARVVGLLS